MDMIESNNRKRRNKRKEMYLKYGIGSLLVIYKRNTVHLKWGRLLFSSPYNVYLT